MGRLDGRELRIDNICQSTRWDTAARGERAIRRESDARRERPAREGG